jgi:hypothetical protein
LASPNHSVVVDSVVKTDLIGKDDAERGDIISATAC